MPKPINRKPQSKQSRLQQKKVLPPLEDGLNFLIRHHLEETAVHINAVRQELLKDEKDHSADIEALNRIGRFLKKIYVQYGGHPDA